MSTPASTQVRSPKENRMAELPRSVKRTETLNPVEWRKFKKSIRGGLYLKLLEEDGGGKIQLSSYQRFWIANFLGKLSEAELLRAFNFQNKLNENAEIHHRNLKALRTAHSNIPLNPPPQKEMRRIGIGYRDKGSRLPIHQQRKVPEYSFWCEDIPWLPLSLCDKDKEHGLITASEVRGSVNATVLEILFPRSGAILDLLSEASGSTGRAKH